MRRNSLRFPRFFIYCFPFMKNFLAVLGLSLAMFTAAQAADYTYEGTVTGVICGSCKQHIQAALTQNLQGTVSVDVKRGDKEDTQKLILVSSNDKVTKETATEALGTYAKNYQILNLDKKH